MITSDCDPNVAEFRMEMTKLGQFATESRVPKGGRGEDRGRVACHACGEGCLMPRQSNWLDSMTILCHTDGPSHGPILEATSPLASMSTGHRHARLLGHPTRGPENPTRIPSQLLYNISIVTLSCPNKLLRRDIDCQWVLQRVCVLALCRLVP